MGTVKMRTKPAPRRTLPEEAAAARTSENFMRCSSAVIPTTTSRTKPGR